MTRSSQLLLGTAALAVVVSVSPAVAAQGGTRSTVEAVRNPLPGTAQEGLVVAPGNLGYAGSLVQLSGNRLVITRSEPMSGGIDLTGDGDADDNVPHIEYLEAGTSLTLPISGVGSLTPGAGRYLILSVREAGQGADLNGDGDMDDYVRHVQDLRTGALRNIGLVFSSWNLEGDLLVFAVAEWKQGSIDLNGDGDTTDRVAHTHALSTGVTTNLGLATYHNDIVMDGGRAMIAVHESGQGVDLDGNGLVSGKVLHVLDTVTGIVENTRFPVYGYYPVGLVPSSGRLVIHVPEQQLGLDLDGDHKLASWIVFLFDPATHARINTGLSWTTHYPQPVVTAGRWVFLGMREAGVGSHYTLHRLDVTTGRFRNLGLSLGDFPFQPTMVVDGHRGALAVRETDVDLNGDGDTADFVLHVIDVSSGRVMNLGLACWSKTIEFADDALTFTAVDPDGDGDISDNTMSVLELDVGRVHHLGRGFWPTGPGSRLVPYLLYEFADATDLNGDGDFDDYVLHVLDRRTGTVSLLGATTQAALVEDARLAFTVDEESAGDVDLNGDGDTVDQIVHLVEM